jgi:hypothetical protein
MPDSGATKLVYEVLSPVGVSIDDKTPAPGTKSGKIPPAPALQDLNGKKIGLVWSAFKNGNVFLEAMEDLLGSKFRGTQFLRLPSGKGLRWGDHPQESMIEIAKAEKLDGAIAAVAG